MRIKNKLSWLLGLLVTFAMASCSNDEELPNGYIGTTIDGSSTFVLQGYESQTVGFNVFTPAKAEKSFYLKEQNLYGETYQFYDCGAVQLSGLTTLPASEWTNSVPVVNGHCYWAQTSTLSTKIYVKFRIAFVEGNNVGIEYVTTSEGRQNANANVGSEKASASLLETPALNASNTYVDHYVTYKGKNIMNFCLEWNAAKKHSAWVAFDFDATTSQVNVNRTDLWAVDPELPTSMQTTEDDHKYDGFDKGHLCASADRLYCTEANNQTFYYSNMSPQHAYFNQRIWEDLEALVQKWGRSTQSGTYDKVYVTKGGTINDLIPNFQGDIYSTDANGYTVKGLACPRYYFMALLSEKNSVYHAIGFIIEHGIYPANTDTETLMTYAVSIDDLEKRTGLDFFCNLPDDVENSIEASFSASDWL